MLARRQLDETIAISHVHIVQSRFSRNVTFYVDVLANVAYTFFAVTATPLLNSAGWAVCTASRNLSN